MLTTTALTLPKLRLSRCLAMLASGVLTLCCTSSMSIAQEPFDILSFDEETMIRYELQNPEARVFQPVMMDLYLNMKVDELRNQLQQYELQVDLTSSELQKLRMRLEEQEDRRLQVYRAIRSLGVHAESVAESIQQLEKMQAEFQIELAGREARREGVSAELDSIVKQIREGQESDPVLDQLRMLLQLRKQDLERVSMLREQGVTSQAEFGRATASVAEAELRVIEHEQSLRDTSGDAFVTSLKSDLVSVTMDIAELRAKIVSIKEQLNQLYEAERVLQESPIGEELVFEAMIKRSIALEEEIAGYQSEKLKTQLKLQTMEDLRAGLDERLAKDKEAAEKQASDEDEN